MPGQDFAEELIDRLHAALAELDITAALHIDGAGDRRWDAIGRIENVPVVIECKAVPTVADVLTLARLHPVDTYPVLVSRRISNAVAAAAIAHEVGFYDARGRLRLWRRPQLLIDATVGEPVDPSGRTTRLRLATPSLLDVALAVLDGSIRDGVRSTAAVLDRSPGTVSKQLRVLRDASLVDIDGEPAVPDLFEAVVEEWRPQRTALAGRPSPGQGRLNDRLQLGLDDPHGPGWVLADFAAAAAWGAPIVTTTAAPPDFYVPNQRTVWLALSLLGAAEHGHHSCTVAVAPAPFVCRRRYDVSRHYNSEFFAPSPIVAALDLAADPARGRETLDLWSRDLPSGVRRVW